MSEDRHRILEMLAQGKINTDEAERLLDAIGEPAGTPAETERPKSKPKFLRVLVKEGKGENVDVRVPIALIRAGIKLGAVIPPEALSKVDTALDEKGIKLDLLNTAKSGDLDELVDALADLRVEVEDGDEHVSVYCE